LVVAERQELHLRKLEERLAVILYLALLHLPVAARAEQAALQVVKALVQMADRAAARQVKEVVRPCKRLETATRPLYHQAKEATAVLEPQEMRQAQQAVVAAVHPQWVPQPHLAQQEMEATALLRLFLAAA